jgi:hypothetical protein
MLVLLVSASVSWWWTVDLSETCRVLYQINLRNSASRWLSLQEYITIHGPMNVKQYICISDFHSNLFYAEKVSSSLCTICIQYAWRWKDRHEHLISINLRLQNFLSASHSMLQVVHWFCLSYGSQDHATRSCLEPYKSIPHFKNPYSLRLFLISSSIYDWVSKWSLPSRSSDHSFV